MTADSRSHRRLHRLLRQDLGGAVSRTAWGTWTTTSSLPHEIRLGTTAGVEFVRVSAAVVLGVPATKALLVTINELNVHRALTTRLWVDDTVLVVAEQPLSALRRGDLENLVSSVLCCGRLDAPHLAGHGGRVTTDATRDLVSEASSWVELFRLSGTATERELALWIEQMSGESCWLDSDAEPEDGPVLCIGNRGLLCSWPCSLGSVLSDVEYLTGVLEEEALMQAELDADPSGDEQALLAWA